MKQEPTKTMFFCFDPNAPCLADRGMTVQESVICAVWGIPLNLFSLHKRCHKHEHQH